MQSRYPQEKLTIIGGGIVGALEAYFAYEDAKIANTSLRITIYEKNAFLQDTTTAGIVPSLTDNEISEVLPPAHILISKLKLLFSEPGGIRVDDVEGVNNTELTKNFIQQVQQYSQDEAGHRARADILLTLGKYSMQLWLFIYETANQKLKAIIEQSNFNPCREPFSKKKSVLHDGYRIDLIYNIPNAKNKAHEMKSVYENLGYQHCATLSPAETVERDPYLSDFCNNNSIVDESGIRQWKDDAIAIWRPGGCIDTKIFLPKFYAYLEEAMGTYLNDNLETKNCFRIKFERNVSEILLHQEAEKTTINGLRFFNSPVIKKNKHAYENSNYVFCPGENIGTLKKLGMDEPAYAGFAGASLKLTIPIPEDKMEKFAALNHCMEVHQEGIVLAWQARFTDNKILIGVAGTKAYYGDQKPNKNQAFAKDRNLLQLNMINDVLPEFVSLALNRNTTGQKLNADDLDYMEKHQLAERWVGIRAVAYDGFPTLGTASIADRNVENARCTTHLGSGGVSFAPGAVFISRKSNQFSKKNHLGTLGDKILEYGKPNRRP